MLYSFVNLSESDVTGIVKVNVTCTVSLCCPLLLRKAVHKLYLVVFFCFWCSKRHKRHYVCLVMFLCNFKHSSYPIAYYVGSLTIIFRKYIVSTKLNTGNVQWCYCFNGAPSVIIRNEKAVYEKTLNIICQRQNTLHYCIRVTQMKSISRQKARSTTRREDVSMDIFHYFTRTFC